MTTSRPIPSLCWPAGAQLAMPGSKSAANRLLVAAALSGHEVLVTGATPSDDVRHLVAGLATLGYRAEFVADDGVRVGPRRPDAADHGELFCGNAGTALRFLVSVAAITPGTWTITGDAAMQRRPIGPLVEAWQQLGADVTAHGGCPPVLVATHAAPLGGAVTLDASVSSQFASSLLLVGANLPRGLTLSWPGKVVSAEYLALTCRTLAQIAITASYDTSGARVAPRDAAPPNTVAVDGDWSSMGVWTCLNHLTASRVIGANLAHDSQQADEALAAALRALPEHGDCEIDVGRFPDQFLNLAIVAAHHAGTTRLFGGTNLRVKECDRIAVMARELSRLGVAVAELPDGLVVHGGQPLRAATIDPERDHRVAMAFALAGLLSPGITVADADCVAKSYPGFWRDLDTVCKSRACLALVGMRGAGKTTLAAALAEATGMPQVDTDQEFVAQHGPIDAFVAAHGWPAFRAEEQRIVASALRPGTIVATGGGAVEAAATRRLLREHAVTLWLDAPVAVLRERLHGATDRPSLTGAPVDQELEAIAARRRDLYAEVAALRLDARTAPGAQVALVRDRLAARCRWPATTAP